MCVAAFIAIASMFVYGMVFFPLFSSLAIGSVFSYGLGTLYVWMMSIVQIFRLVELECNVTAVSSISTLNSFSLRFYLAQTPNACLPYHIVPILQGRSAQYLFPHCLLPPPHHHHHHHHHHVVHSPYL